MGGLDQKGQVEKGGRLTILRIGRVYQAGDP